MSRETSSHTLCNQYNSTTQVLARDEATSLSKASPTIIGADIVNVIASFLERLNERYLGIPITQIVEQLSEIPRSSE